MALSIEEVLGYVPLTKAIETVKSGVPRLLPNAFYDRKPQFRILGDKTRRVETQGTRKAARVVPYGAPPRQITHLPLSARDIRLLHCEEVLNFSHELFLQIREFDSYTVQEKFREEAMRQVQGAVTRQMNLETTLVNVMLANGKIWFDSSGNPQATSASADLEIDYGVPANNLNQINGVIDASWATTSTNIVQHINDIKMKAVNTTGYPLKYALYGKNIMRYLVKNDTVKEYLRYHVGENRAGYFLDQNQIPPGLFGLEWIPMQNSFFETDGGTVTEIFGADTVTFCPDPADPNVYGIYEGSYPVPTSMGVYTSVEQAWGAFENKYGKYGYGRMVDKPLGIAGVYGDTFLPSLHNPSAFFICDTTP